MSRKLQLEQAYRAAVDEIAALCRAGPYAAPNLVAVSKYKPVEDIQVLYDLGHRHFGENYVQELTEKAQRLPRDIRWHFIGSLQSNKAKVAREIPNLAFVETLDSVSKATKLDAQRAQVAGGAPLGVYLQVNTSDEPQKAGIPAASVAELAALARHVRDACAHLELAGLMTIGSLEQSQSSRAAGADAENRDFARLAELRDALAAQLDVPAASLGLSMGMSADYLQAIRQGATNVRVGSSIFGGRLTKDEVKSQPQ